MKFSAVLFLILICSGIAVAQDANSSSGGLPSQSIREGAWELGFFGGGGNGLAYAQHTRFAYAGARAGLVLTKDHFSGWRRGNFEWAIDVMPVYTVFTPARPVYGGSFKPAIWKWNFTSGKRLAPYIVFAGGIVFSTSNIPPGKTSWVNFSPQAALGTHIFSKAGRALFVEGSYVHHSDAGLSAMNPGYNASLFFTIGYEWFKRPA
jgi:hypothetical protein